MRTEPIRVLIADDEPVLCDAIARLVAGVTGLEFAGAAADATQAVALAATTKPDVVLVDVKMPGGGPAAVRGIKECSPTTRALAFSAYDERAAVVEMLRAGAVGYLVKGVAPGEIVDAIRRAVRGQSSLSAETTARVINDPIRDAGATVEMPDGPTGSARIRGSTERRHAPDARPERDDRYAALLESAPDAVVVVDPEGQIVLVNRQTEALFGYGREELVGESIELLLPERFRASHERQRRGFVSATSARAMGTSLELVGLRKDGREFPVDISLTTTETNQGRLATAFIRDISERRLQEQLERDTATRRELLAHLAWTEEERRRIAADVHDDSIQAITAAGMRLQILRRSLSDPHQLGLLTELERTIQRSISRLRHLVFELVPPTLESDGLAAALRMYLNEVEQRTGLCYRLEDELTSQPSTETRLVLYRIAQEALTNISKHARATSAEIRLDEVEGGYRIRVTDDGIGFAPEQTIPAPGHLGLAGMRERVGLAGGWLQIDGSLGNGTTVEFWVPASPPPPPAPALAA